MRAKNETRYLGVHLKAVRDGVRQQAGFNGESERELGHEGVAGAKGNELPGIWVNSQMGKTGTHMIFLKNIANGLPFHTLCFGGKLCLFYKGGKERAVVLILGKVSVLEKIKSH